MDNTEEPRGEVPAETDTLAPEPVKPEGEHTQRVRALVVQALPEIVEHVTSAMPEPPRAPVADKTIVIACIACVCVWVALGKATVAEAAGTLGTLLAVITLPNLLNKRSK